MAIRNGMKEPLVDNEAVLDFTGLETGAIDRSLIAGDGHQDVRDHHDNNATCIVSSVQPGIYSGFTPSYGTVETGGPRAGIWTHKQVFGVDENKERGNWTGRFEYLLAMLGYAVGLGNIWRFPYLCYKHGGGAFLVPYLFFMTFVGIPLFFLESALGQFTSCGPTTCWQFAPLFQGIGLAMMISSFIISGYYCMIIAWCHFYFFASFTGTLPWTNCDGAWTTHDCSTKLPDVDCTSTDNVSSHRYDNGTCYHGDTFTGLWNYSMFTAETGRVRVAPTKEYWEQYVLGLSRGIEETGQPQWRLVLCLLFSWTLVFLCLIKGIKSAGKVVYFTAIFPYIVLLILFVRGVTLDNAILGIKYYIVPEFHKLGDITIWKAAAVQIFYSMGPAGGGIVALSSYNRFHNNVLRDSLIVSLGNCLTSIFGGFVIFSFVGHMAGNLNVHVDQVADDGPGIAFIVYPEAVQSLPAPTFWSIIFFFMLITLGIDSQFASVEAILTGLIDYFPRYRQHKTLAIFVICVVMFLLGLPFTTSSGVYWVTLVDYYAAAWGVLLTGLCEVIAIAYVYGVRRFCRDIEVMIGPWSTLYWKICWLAVTPLSIMFILLYGWIEYIPVKYNDYLYPGWAEGLGWMISFTAISTVPIVMGVKLYSQNKGQSLLQKLRHLTQPTRDWGPALVRHRQLMEQVPGFVVDPTADDTDTDHIAYRNMSHINHTEEVQGVTESETTT